MDAVLDTTVLIHLFRMYTPAVNWLNTQNQYGVTTITWFELMEGATNKANQARCKALLAQFQLIHLTSADQTWAMQQLEQLQFSHHVGYGDF